jgi:predicted metal-dependent hydrolase
MSETITLNGIIFHIQRSSRRKTISLIIERDNQVVIRAPSTATREQLTQMAQRRALWVHTKLQTKQAYSQRARPKEFVDGEGFFYFGRSYRLRVVPVQSGHKRPALHLHGTWFELRSDARPKAAQYFARWYAEHGQSWIETRVDFYARRIGVTPAKVEIRNLQNRWASCSKNGNIIFHWRIVCLPPSIIDYIIAHELAHLAQPHHGKDFWQLLERTMPDYATRKKWLDENGGQF